MNPHATRILIFMAIIIAAMLIIIGVASISHAAECLPSARAVWAAHPGSHATWNVVGDVKCWRVGHPRKEGMYLGSRPTTDRKHDARPRPAHSPAGAVIWKYPEHAKLFEEFEEWLYLGKR